MSENKILNFNEEKYSNFIKTLSIYKDICNDLDIRNGIIRQRLNEQYYTIEMDLRSMLEENTIPVSNIKQTIDLLKIFSKSEITSLNIEENKNFTISDNLSNLTFQMPILSLLDNKHLSEEDLSSIFPINPEGLIVKCKISKIICDRIKVICHGFSINSLIVNFNGDNSSIGAETQSMDKKSIIINNITMNKIIEDLSYIRFVHTPFLLDHDEDIDLEIYDSGNNIFISKFNMKLNEINFSLYTSSKLKYQEID